MRAGRVNWALFTALVLMVCAGGRGGAVPAAPSVRISEIHYDNTGTDSGEAIEVSAPAGTNLTGWRLVLYNGSTGLSYAPEKTLSGTVGATCGTRGVVVVTYASNEIQNGSPDAVALVDASGAVVEYLSYEGAFKALNGPANGLTSTNIGVFENGSEPVGLSLQRNGDGTWNAPAAHTFGSCNDSDSEPPADVASVTVSPATATVFEGAAQAFAAAAFDSNGQAVPDVAFTWTTSNPAIATVSAAGVATGVATGEATITATSPNGIAASATLSVQPAPPVGPHGARFSEIHYDNDGADAGEAIEIEAAAGTSLAGWSIVLYNGGTGASYSTRALSGFVPNTCDGRGVVVLMYPESIQNGAPDGMALVDNNGTVIEFLSYEGTFTATNGPAAGLLSADIGVSQNSAVAGRSLQRYANDAWSPAPHTFGQCNGAAPPVLPALTISGRTFSDPPLPVGFQDQLFATLRDELSGAVIPTTFTWSTDTPAIASIDQLGVMTALAEGTAVLRATAANGTTVTRSLPTRVAVASPTASYVGNAAFGEPADNDPSDDYILRYAQFVASYNPTRGSPNWVAYEIDPSHYGPEDRCDCFTFDHALPAEFMPLTTADYTGAAAFHGYSIDRGHLARSFDRTAGSLDNARTFYFSNIVPQAGDLNQGPWAAFEAYLGDLVRFGGKEVYVLTGVAGSKGTLKNEGKIVIPESTWKVAVIMPHDTGLADVVDYRSLEVIAVNMPNEPGVRNVPWATYKTTVDAIEALTGYDLLALLDDKTEKAVESNTQPPFAVSDGPYSSLEGGAVAMGAAASFDPNGTVGTYVWLLGDGTSATGPTVTHTYMQDGTYTVTLVVTDNDGLTDTITTTATVANVAPAVAPLAGATLLPGETYTTSGSFTDPGADAWSATVDYGDGATPLALSGQTFTLSRVYQSAGTFTVTVTVNDDDASGTAMTTVTVLSASDAIQQALAAVAGVNSLEVKLAGAVRNIANGEINGALGKLQATLNEIDAMVRSGRMPSADAAAVSSLITRTIQSLSR